MAIEQLLKNKNTQEKSSVKSQEISKLKHSGIFDSAEYGVTVEIVGDVTPITAGTQTGVQVFARAWKNGKQLGFSADGSVEIERFRIFNPPILVDDVNGAIVRESIDSHTGILKQRKLREDPLEAIRQSLSHTIKLIGKENTQVILGKIGNTTATFYPDAGDPGTTSVDGRIVYDNTGVSWATGVGAATGTSVSSTDTLQAIFSSFWNSGTSRVQIMRGVFLFDTSSLGSGATVSGAILSIFFTAVFDGDNDADGYSVVVASTPASNTTLSTADYDQVLSVEKSTQIDTTAITTSAYNDYTLNDLTTVAKTGISKYGIREGHDLNNVAPASLADCYANGYFADQTGTANDPKLVVTYTTASPDSNCLSMGHAF